MTTVSNTLSLFKSHSFETPLGAMIAISDDSSLYLLEFIDRPDLTKEIEQLTCKHKVEITPEITPPISNLMKELDLYFSGKLQRFNAPIHLTGSEFQTKAWRALMKIPYGTTKSYTQQATEIGNSKACRAVARANSTNQLAIIVPCHRVINSSGTIGGYAGGIKRKEWLINHEKQYI